MDRFEQKFDVYQVKDDQDEYEVELDPEEEIIVKPGDMFQLGNHILFCGAYTDKVFAEILSGIKSEDSDNGPAL
jgi:hypothetical protein